MRTPEDVKKEYWEAWDEQDRLDRIYTQQIEEYDRIKWTHMQKVSTIQRKLHTLFEEFAMCTRGMDNPGSLNDGYPEYLAKRKETLGY